MDPTQGDYFAELTRSTYRAEFVKAVKVSAALICDIYQALTVYNPEGIYSHLEIRWSGLDADCVFEDFTDRWYFANPLNRETLVPQYLIVQNVESLEAQHKFAIDVETVFDQSPHSIDP